MAKFRAEGKSIDYTPIADTAAGTLVKVGTNCGVADNDIKANVKGALRVCGIFELMGNNAGATIAQGTEMDVVVGTGRFAAQGAGDADIKIFAADPIPNGTDIKARFFINQWGG